MPEFNNNEPNKGEELDKFYANLKKRLAEPSDGTSDNNYPAPMTVSTAPGTPGEAKWLSKVSQHCMKLKDDCRKHIILDIYVKTLPLDDDFKIGHMGMMKQDVDQMLTSKGMSPTQYLTSAFESTHAPLLEYILWATDTIASNYMKEAKEDLKNAQKDGVDLPDPEQPSVDDDEIESQLVDVKNDMEYETFVDKLRQQTINRIVSDVTEIINKESEADDMEFNPKPDAASATSGIDDLPDDSATGAPPEMDDIDDVKKESAVIIAADYLQYRLLKESFEVGDNEREGIIGMAIREATFFEMDRVFNQPYTTPELFKSKIFLGKGIICNESAIQSLRVGD